MKKYALVLLLLINYCYAIPTMEGLFRNSKSEDVTKNLVVIEMTIEKEEVQIPSNEEVLPPKKKQLVKYLIHNKENERKNFIYARYEDTFDFNDLLEARIFNSLKNKTLSDQKFDRKLFKAILSMYTLNTSEIIASVLKNINTNFKLNNEVLNNEKKQLLESYMKFLKDKKEYDEKLKDNKDEESLVSTDTIPEPPKSPLVPEIEEDKEKVNEIISKSMYKDAQSVKLIKKGRSFQWSVELENINALFNNQTHALEYLKINHQNIDFEIIPSKYVTFSGVYHLPSGLKFKAGNDVYNIEIKNFYAIESTKDIATRYREYKKKEEENQERRKKLTIDGSTLNVVKLPIIY